MTTDVASMREYRTRFPITYGFVIVLVIVMIGDVVGKVLTGTESWASSIGIGQGILLADEPYRIMTYAFFHTSWYHLATNVMIILVLGTWFESYLPRLWYLWLWFSGVIGAGLAVWSWHWCFRFWFCAIRNGSPIFYLGSYDNGSARTNVYDGR